MQTLAILICTLPERSEKLKRLLNILNPQIAKYKDRVFYSLHDAGRGMPTGTKRNHLIQQTSSDYFVFIDDDDVVPIYYVHEIMEAIDKSQPDVITYQGYMTTNGDHRRNWTIKLGSDYNEIDGHYYRWPNHIVPMRRDKVRGVSFPDVWVQEDYLWSKAIRDKGLLQTEEHIEKDMYWYDFYQKRLSPRAMRKLNR